MIPSADLHQFDVHSDGYFAHLPLNYVDGVILEMFVPRMPYEQLADFLEEKPSQKRYCNDFSVDEMVDWAKMEVETEGVAARNSTTEGVEAKNSTTEGVEARNSATEGVEAKNSATEGVEARIRTTDMGKEKVSEDASDVVETKRCTVEVDTETEYESDDESDYQSDKLVVHKEVVQTANNLDTTNQVARNM
ncbi:hypothetical protein Tco_0491673 [Tanacetum coccineum]